MLSPAEFGALFEGFQRSAFRVELLPAYLVPEEAEELRAYLACEPKPASLDEDAGWLADLRARADEGRPLSRVHVVTGPLSEYLRYECEWGYTASTRCGEQVRILDLAEVSYSDPLPDFDFWLFDDETGVRMRYAPDGTYQHAELLPPGEVPPLVAHRTALTAGSVPFADYWAAHPEYHRD